MTKNEINKLKSMVLDSAIKFVHCDESEREQCFATLASSVMIFEVMADEIVERT